ncbi:putative glycosyltransferase [Xenorhabdus poinarii G6]|uniref:Putative glycosyltransferase n=1 Tax=Xenorhabdus poinarii G6 TaxID=1354304 RepID=A0A068R090_9GAMM|nr:putative glycosyltransferase [Xenorhabdus poinarii G6]
MNENLISELQDFEINYANIIGSTSIKYPTFLRKIALTKKIEKAKADKTIIWDFVPRLSRKPKNTDFIYYDHGSSWQYRVNNKTLKFFNMLDSAIAVSHASKRVMELKFNPKIEIQTVINRLPCKSSIRNKSITNKQTIILGTASRLIGLKGIGIAILALNELLKKGIKAKLIIAGEGEQKEDLRNLAIKLGIEENVEFIGYQSDMATFYSIVDIYISTPVAEAFGLSCIEAISNGVPVIFPLSNGQPEAIKNKICGIGIIPDISVDEYYQMTGLTVNFPHDIYDPINDCMTSPKLINPAKCAVTVQLVISDYNQLSKNAIEWSKETMNYNLFIKEFELAINNK